ncbi:hypothetical protein Ancab_016811 [Ancistrocladus abbreviatus]
MPRGSKKSIGYRSFITCDDPKGVVECGTIRISKISSQKREHKSEDQRKQKSVNTALREKEEKKEMGVGGISGGQVHSPTSLQLLQVSRGAQKLSHVISSCSNRRSHDGQPKDIAEDLLKGALDLRQSLAVLSRLQQVSNSMSGSARKKKQQLEGRGVEDIGFGMMDLNQLKDEKHHMGVQKPALSVDQSSRYSFEVKKVIGDALVRQHDSVTEQLYDCRKLDSSDIPSTSSSQSTVVGSSNFMSSESSHSSTASQKKARRSNLITKLMGLESLPPSPRRHMGNAKFSSQMNPMFDIDFPMGKNPQFATEMVDRKQSTLDELLDTVKFKGLLESNSLNGISSTNSQHHETLDSKGRWIDDKPPIVVMKPRRISCANVVEPIVGKSRADVAWDELLMKLRSRRDHPCKIAYREASSSKEKSREVKTMEAPMQNLGQGGGAHSREVQGKLERTRVRGMENGFPGQKKASVHQYHNPQEKQIADGKGDEAPKATSTRRKGEEMKIVKSGSELKSEDQAKLPASKLKRPKDGISIKKSPISKQQINDFRPTSKCETRKITSDSSSNWRRITQGIEKTVMKKPTSPDYRGYRSAEKDIQDPLENKSVLPTAETFEAEQIFRDVADACQTHVKDYEDNSGSPSEITSLIIHEDNSAAHQYDNPSSLPEIIIPMHEEDGTADNSNDSHCYLCESASLPVNVEGTSGQHKDSLSTISKVTLLTTDDGGDAAHLNGGHGSSHEIALPDENEESTADHHEHNAEKAETNSQNFDHVTPTEGLTVTSKLKALLLSSPLFMNRAEELFYLKAKQDLVAPTTIDGEPNVAGSRVLLECAVELMELKSSQYVQTHMPLLQNYRTGPKNYIYLDQLLEEICEGTEALRCYSEPGCETLPNDSLSVLLGRDLRYTGMASGTWDIGWRNAFSLHEVEEIVGEVDKLVLAGLIDEVFDDLRH